MKAALEILHKSPLLVLFLVSAAGYLLGHLEVAGLGLGVAAVLFVGLAVGAADPTLALPEVVQQFGLVLFVYSVGLASGPGFFASFRRRGLRDNGMAIVVLLLGAALAWGLGRALGLSSAKVAGLFAGSLTNTPALASVLEALGGGEGSAAALEPVVAYSVAYPFGVLGVILAMVLAKRVFRATADAPASGRAAALSPGALENLTVKLGARSSYAEATARLRAEGLLVVLGRMARAGRLSIATEETTFEPGDRLTLVGREGDLQRAAALLGEATDEHLELDRQILDFRRVFVSRPDVTEKPLRDLRIPERFGALVTRIRRGDVDLLPTADAELELGDRVRVVAPRERMAEVAGFFGDSYKALAEIDVITFSLGVALGLVLGALPVPLPGGAHFKLGIAGGPLVVGLLLGRLGRSGRLVWTLPFSAGLTLRQLGLVLFLAGVGTRSGHAFVSTLREGGGLAMLAAGAAVTFTVAFTTALVGRRLFGAPMDVVSGTVSGVHTQPAALAFALRQARSDAPNVGYAAVFPVATIAKILIAQLLLGLGRP